jgi:hypothetical protein
VKEAAASELLREEERKEVGALVETAGSGHFSLTSSFSFSINPKKLP